MCDRQHLPPGAGPASTSWPALHPGTAGGYVPAGPSEDLVCDRQHLQPDAGPASTTRPCTPGHSKPAARFSALRPKRLQISQNNATKPSFARTFLPASRLRPW